MGGSVGGHVESLAEGEERGEDERGETREMKRQAKEGDIKALPIWSTAVYLPSDFRA